MRKAADKELATKNPTILMLSFFFLFVQILVFIISWLWVNNFIKLLKLFLIKRWQATV